MGQSAILDLDDLSRVSGQWDAEFNDDVWGDAVAAEDDPDGCLVASLKLLAGAVLGSDKAQGLDWLWDENREFYHAAPVMVRAAIMQALGWVARYGGQVFEPMPTAEARLSRDLPEVEAQLIAVAKAMTAEEVDAVTGVVWCDDWRRHKAALQKMLASADVAYPAEDKTWYPAEAVESTAHMPKAVGYAPCLAIVVLDAVRGGDVRDFTLDSFGQIVRTARECPTVQRRAVMAGLRYLYESNSDWGPGSEIQVGLRSCLDSAII